MSNHLIRFFPCVIFSPPIIEQVGEFGRASDGGIYASSDLGRGMAAQTLQVPEDEIIPGADHLGKMPYCMVGDAAFPLRPYLMRPYGGRRRDRRQRLFDYRLCRARMSVEKAFGESSKFFQEPGPVVLLV